MKKLDGMSWSESVNFNECLIHYMEGDTEGFRTHYLKEGRWNAILNFVANLFHNRKLWVACHYYDEA